MPTFTKNRKRTSSTKSPWKRLCCSCAGIFIFKQKTAYDIGNHTLHHEQNASSASLHETNRLIREATGFRPCDFRPPDGAVDPGLISRAHAERLVTVNWDVDPRDWADPGVSAIVSNVISNARNGSIVVMHDGPSGARGETIAALPAILSHFRQRGYQFVTVAELLGHKFVYPAPQH